MSESKDINEIRLIRSNAPLTTFHMYDDLQLLK
jgi:hypothetical protein